MNASDTLPPLFQKGDKVVAANPLPGIPEGSLGKVKLVNGVTWTRYWVFFNSGQSLGSIDGSDLVLERNWESFVADRAAQREVEAERAAQPPAAATEEAEDAPDTSGAAAAADTHGVPAHLIERSRLARERLGVPRS